MAAKHFGRYEIKRVLGRGGMSVVYLAYDPKVKREVAIKVLPSHLLEDPSFRDRLEREVQTVARLEHSCIVPVYDYGEEEGRPYVVMRYMPGGSLASRIKQRPLTLVELSRVVGRVARALDKVHGHNIIHRDVKPGNILFDGDGEAYLADFGIAKAVQSSATKTTSGTSGTPAYASPELCRGAKTLDGRSDIYSLGVVVFEALTGQQPYQADTPVGLAMQHLTQRIPSICAIRPDLPADYEIVIRQAMAKIPDERYATAGELAADVASIAGGEPVVPRVELAGSVTARLPKMPAGERLDRAKSRPLLYAGVALILVILAVAGVAMYKAYSSSLGPTTLPQAPASQVAPNLQSPIALSSTVTQTPSSSGTLYREATAETLVAAASATQTTSAPTLTHTPTSTPSLSPTDTPESTPTSTPPFTSTNVAAPAGALAAQLTDTPTREPLGTPTLTATATRPPQANPPEMILVLGGEFVMGSSDADLDAAQALCDLSEGNCQRDWFLAEMPQHTVFVDTFLITKNEITNAQYQQCVMSGICEPPNTVSSGNLPDSLSNFAGDSWPVVGIDWHDANAYCRWIGARLPTEAEWEKAARGTDGRLFPWGNAYDSSRANSCDVNCPLEDFKVPTHDDGFARTAPVGSFSTGASPYGLMDMGGNVWEWTSSLYQPYPYDATDGREDPDSTANRVLRGGGWSKYDFRCRVTDRVSLPPNYADYDIGFRCAKSP